VNDDAGGHRGRRRRSRAARADPIKSRHITAAQLKSTATPSIRLLVAPSRYQAWKRNVIPAPIASTPPVGRGIALGLNSSL